LQAYLKQTEAKGLPGAEFLADIQAAIADAP
jgi:hypothetical protein